MSDIKNNKEWQEIQKMLGDVKPPKPGFFEWLFGKSSPKREHTKHEFDFGPKYSESWTRWRDDGTIKNNFIRHFQDKKCRVCGYIEKVEVKLIEKE